MLNTFFRECINNWMSQKNWNEIKPQ